MNGLQAKRLDWSMLATIVLLMVISVAFVFSARFKSADAYGDTWQSQLIFAALGLSVYAALVWFDYKIFAALSWWVYAGAIGLLLLVFLFEPNNGAQRWIPLPGFTIQPSELAKIAVAIQLGAYLGTPDRDVDEWKTFFACAAIAGLPFLLIKAQPDLSTSLTLAPITLSIMLYAGVKRRFLLICTAVFVLGAATACVWIKYEKPPQEMLDKGAKAAPDQILPRMPILQDYQKDRIRVFLRDDHDVAGAGWNKLQSRIALGSGGLRGKGYLKGAQNILGFLPPQVAQSDFIFCVIGEEKGFMGGALIIALYAVLLSRCMRASLRSRDEFGRMLALGIGVMLFCHVFVNIAMTMGMLPITGLPLPLMSYGGSFMVSTMIALGLTQSVYQRRRIR